MQQRDEFIATLAHELRGPLAPLRTSIDLARARQSDDPLIISAMNIADRQVTRLVRLVDDLLDIGRITSGQLEIRRESVVLRDVIARSIEGSLPIIEEHHHHMLSDLESSSAVVLGDADRLVQVFANLLTNAAKYTPDGGHIAISLTADDTHATVHVQDTGIGLASDQLQRVFELFTRVRDTQYIGVDGLGVGLALARHLIEQHGGTITVSSKGEMRGSRFTVRLPLQEATLHGIPPRAMTSARRRVLVVDDHIDSTDTMALLLEALGHEAIVANDGASALRCAAEQPPDLILLDLGLPDLDGVEVARLLRLRPGGETLRIVALTGWGQPADRERTREAGFDLHFVKPLSREALETLVNTLAEAGPSISPPMLPPA